MRREERIVADGVGKPRIRLIDDGPAVYVPAPDGEPNATLESADGTAEELDGRTRLCRCGGSRVKPYCDNRHLENGYTSARHRHANPDKRVDYEGREVTVHDVRGVCAHVEYCIKGSPEVFRVDVRPWIDPDGADAQTIESVVRSCPSGALTYTRDGVRYEDWDGPPRVYVNPDSCYEVSGGVELLDGEFASTVPRDHYTLCRCGGSKNKPFCDGTHWINGFSDAGDYEGGASAMVKGSHELGHHPTTPPVEEAE